MSFVQKSYSSNWFHPSTQLLIRYVAAILTVFRFNWDRSFHVWMLTSYYNLGQLEENYKIRSIFPHFWLFHQRMRNSLIFSIANHFHQWSCQCICVCIENSMLYCMYWRYTYAHIHTVHMCTPKCICLYVHVLYICVCMWAYGILNTSTYIQYIQYIQYMQYTQIHTYTCNTYNTCNM
jgi:hypothetical protein